ncbi:MAG TPA: hypothetical protein VF327_08905 [Gaiellaceae bacterium]
MRRTVLTAAVGIAVLAASIVLALLGRAVLAAPGAIDRGAPGWPARGQVETHRRSLADRAAASLLAAERADTFTRIVGIYRDAIALSAAAGDPKDTVQISQLIPKLRSPEERAQALVMAGTLLAYSAGSGFGVILPGKLQAPTATLLAQALEDFRAAVRTDPANEEAKYDVELLLRQRKAQAPSKPQGTKRKKAPATQDKRKKKKTANGQEHHAGVYASGSGY